MKKLLLIILITNLISIHALCQNKKSKSSIYEVNNEKLLITQTWQQTSTEFNFGQLYCNQCPQFNFGSDSILIFNGQKSNLRWYLVLDSLILNVCDQKSDSLNCSQKDIKNLDYLMGRYKIKIYRRRKQKVIYMDLINQELTRHFSRYSTFKERLFRTVIIK